jgi:DNA-binding PadR family transcriptional regulator
MLGVPEATILAILARRPSSGYNLRSWLEQTGIYLGYRSSLSPIYRTLARLEARGLVLSVTEKRHNAPDAKVYRLTEGGREAVVAWARSPYVPSRRPMDPDFGVRFVLGGQFGRDIALTVLREELQYRLKQKDEQGEAVRLTPNGFASVPELDPSWAMQLDRLAHERGYASTAAYIAWLELTIARLEATAPPD